MFRRRISADAALLAHFDDARRTLQWNRSSHPSVAYSTAQMEKVMDREHIKGAADKAKGAIKDAAGKMTGDKELQSEGKLDKAKGAAHDAAGNVKDAARDLTK
jgi:uncharacterized protein YjbJ (UPF0337 family)